MRINNLNNNKNRFDVKIKSVLFFQNVILGYKRFWGLRGLLQKPPYFKLQTPSAAHNVRRHSPFSSPCIYFYKEPFRVL